MICRISETSAATQPFDSCALPFAVGVISGTTTGPATPAGAWWMCIATIGCASPLTTTWKHTRPSVGLSRNSAVPVALGSPAGTSTPPDSFAVKPVPSALPRSFAFAGAAAARGTCECRVAPVAVAKPTASPAARPIVATTVTHLLRMPSLPVRTPTRRGRAGPLFADYGKGRKSVFGRRLRGRRRREVRLQHRVDLRRTRPPVQPIDDALSFHQDERRDHGHLEPLRELRLFVDVHTHHAQPRPLLASQMRQQALHSPRGARPLGAEEDEQRPSVVHRDSSCP